jgi:hypothetical protein
MERKNKGGTYSSWRWHVAESLVDWLLRTPILRASRRRRIGL